MKPGQRREPLWNCPLCKGKGEIFWQLYSSVPPSEWVCIGRKKPKPPKTKGALIMAESGTSAERREVWMKHAAHFDGNCLCTTMRVLDYTQLKRTASQIQRIVHNERPRQHTLNDDLENI
jgi:hypothetical protein